MTFKRPVQNREVSLCRELQARGTVSYFFYVSDTHGFSSPKCAKACTSGTERGLCSKEHIAYNAEISPLLPFLRTYVTAEHTKELKGFIALSLEKNHTAWMWKSSCRKGLQPGARSQRRVFHVMEEECSI